MRGARAKLLAEARARLRMAAAELEKPTGSTILVTMLLFTAGCAVHPACPHPDSAKTAWLTDAPVSGSPALEPLDHASLGIWRIVAVERPTGPKKVGWGIAAAGGPWRDPLCTSTSDRADWYTGYHPSTDTFHDPIPPRSESCVRFRAPSTQCGGVTAYLGTYEYGDELDGIPEAERADRLRQAASKVEVTEPRICDSFTESGSAYMVSGSEGHVIVNVPTLFHGSYERVEGVHGTLVVVRARELVVLDVESRQASFKDLRTCAASLLNALNHRD